MCVFPLKFLFPFSFSSSFPLPPVPCSPSPLPPPTPSLSPRSLPFLRPPFLPSASFLASTQSLSSPVLLSAQQDEACAASLAQTRSRSCRSWSWFPCLYIPWFPCRVKWILDRTKRSLEEINFLSDTESLSASQVPWAQVLDACVNFILMSLHLDPDLSESEVHFFPEDREKHVLPTQWRRSVNLSREEAAEAEEKRRWTYLMQLICMVTVRGMLKCIGYHSKLPSFYSWREKR